MLHIKQTDGKGRGVFATTAIRRGKIVIRDEVIVLPKQEYKLIKPSILGEYYFDWYKTRFIALGYSSILNHSETPNCDWEFKNSLIIFKAIKSIKAGEELTYDYGRDSYYWKKPLVFSKIPYYSQV